MRVDWRTALHDGLRQVETQSGLAAGRMRRRRDAIVAAALLCAGFFLLAKVPLILAMAGFLLTLAGAALWPTEGATSASSAPRGAARSELGDVWKRIIEGFPEPALALSESGHILHLNTSSVELIGNGRRGMHITAMSRDPGLLSAIDQALAGGETNTVELQQRVPLERRRLVTVAPIVRAQGPTETPALLITLRDLSEQDRLARMRADFVANASHELRTPLASLKGFVETLQGAAKDDPTARERFLKVMSEQAERMTRLIDDLLSLSRVEMREHLPPSARVDLNETLAHVTQSLQPLVERAGATLRVKPLGGEALVRGDRDELVQVFQNLVQNALKYGRAGGRVDVEVRRYGSRLVVAISDDGPGIAPQHLPRLTERFYRVSVAASREKGGTGLGLAIVKHILNRHRGELTVVSEIGKGSTFSVHLPAIS